MGRSSVSYVEVKMTRGPSMKKRFRNSRYDPVKRNFQRVVKAWLKANNELLPIPYTVIQINNKKVTLRLKGIKYVYVVIYPRWCKIMEAELIIFLRNKGNSYDYDDILMETVAEPVRQYDGTYICQMCNDHIEGSSEIYQDLDDILNRHVLDGLRQFSEEVERKPFLHYRAYKGEGIFASRLFGSDEPQKYLDRCINLNAN